MIFNTTFDDFSIKEKYHRSAFGHDATAAAASPALVAAILIRQGF